MTPLHRRPETRDEVDTPHGRGWLLHPVNRTERQSWVVLVGTKGYVVRVDDMTAVEGEEQGVDDGDS